MSAVATNRALDVGFASDEAVDGLQNLPQPRTSTLVATLEITQAQRLKVAVSTGQDKRSQTKAKTSSAWGGADGSTGETIAAGCCVLIACVLTGQTNTR